jgi:hypothetical protein
MCPLLLKCKRSVARLVAGSVCFLSGCSVLGVGKGGNVPFVGVLYDIFSYRIYCIRMLFFWRLHEILYICRLHQAFQEATGNE